MASAGFLGRGKYVTSMLHNDAQNFARPGSTRLDSTRLDLKRVCSARADDEDVAAAAAAAASHDSNTAYA